MKRLALLLSLAACGAEPRGLVQAGSTPPAGTDVALAILEEDAAPLRLEGLLRWEPAPIQTADGPVAGYAILEYGPTFVVVAEPGVPVYRTALAHEIGHYVWASRTGDTWTAGEGDPAFYAWVDGENARIRAALETAP